MTAPARAGSCSLHPAHTATSAPLWELQGGQQGWLLKPCQSESCSVLTLLKRGQASPRHPPPPPTETTAKHLLGVIPLPAVNSSQCHTEARTVSSSQWAQVENTASWCFIWIYFEMKRVFHPRWFHSFCFNESFQEISILPSDLKSSCES